MTLYTMTLKVLKIRKILLFISLLFFGGCQLTQSTDQVKSDLNVTSIDEENSIENLKQDSSEIPQADVKKEEEALNSEIEESEDKNKLISYLADLFGTEDEITLKEAKKDSDQKLKSKLSDKEEKDFYKPEKAKDEKRIIPLSLIDKIEKSEKLGTQPNFYKPEKPKDEKRILSFFTGFFENKNQQEIDGIEPNDVKESIISGYERKNDNKEVVEKDNLLEKKDKRLETKIEKNDNLIKNQLNEDEAVIEKIEKVESKEDLTIDEKTNNETDSLSENIDEVYNNGESENFAFFDLKKPKSKKIKKQPLNNYVGLLLPLTGEKRSAGNLVLNTFRYSLVRKPMDINFKIYDTKGTKNGAVQAANKGKKDGVKTFVGPIFSDETKALKDFFQNEKNITFFSLSPDTSNVSDNIIVSGQNPQDQMICISENLMAKKINDLLLIYHNDKYGEIVRNSLVQGISNFDAQADIKTSYLKISQNLDLNNEIKSISQFEKRKKSLKRKRMEISKDKNIPNDEKKRELKKLDRQLTLDVPFDAVIIASEGDKLLEILSHLAFYDINAENTLIYGTSLWEDTDKTDKVFENTFYVTNLKEKSETFSKNFKDVFAVEPSSVNFHLVDLIDLVNDYKYYEIYPENKIHIGEFTNTLLQLGSLKRETFLKKNKYNNKVEKVSSCQLDAL